jgi:hypothetical protein
LNMIARLPCTGDEKRVSRVLFVMVISLGADEQHRSRRRLRDCSRPPASASHRLCRLIRRLLQGGLPFSAGAPEGVRVGFCCSRHGYPWRQSGLSVPLPVPPWLSPGTPLCAARTFLDRNCSRPRPSVRPTIRLSTCGSRREITHGAEGEI